MSVNQNTQQQSLLPKCRSQKVDSLVGCNKRNDTTYRKDDKSTPSRNSKNIYSEKTPLNKTMTKNPPRNSDATFDDMFSPAEPHSNQKVRMNSTKHKGNLTTLSHLPSLQISMESPGTCSRRNSKESLDEGTTCLSNKLKKIDNCDTSVDGTVTKEISRMFDLTNGFQREILSLEEDFKGNAQMKLLKRQVVFVKWINELTESNMYLLNLMDNQNKGYEDRIVQYKQAIKHIVSEMENCKQDSLNLRFDSEGLADQNKFMQKLIQTLQDNLKYRENEIRTLEILKETCDTSKSSLLEVLTKLRDGKTNFSGEEFSPFFKSKSKYITTDEGDLRKELQYLRKEKHEMEKILMIKNGEIRKLKEAVYNHEMQQTQSSSQHQEAQTIVSFDKDLKLEGHEDLFVFK